jgi:hypothetical protein
MLVINDCSDIYVHVDLGLWILHSDLGQPSQISEHGTNVKVFINSPYYGRGQCSQSNMGTVMGQTTSHLHQQHA